MLKPTTTTLGRHGRWLFLVCSAGLLATVCGLYIRSAYLYYHHYTPVVAAGGASLDLRPVPDANKDTAIGHTGDHSAWNLTAPDVEDGEDNESTLLHPERHVFRDPTTIHMTWNVTLEPRAPDGVMKLVYLINGRFPGPTIEARSGDELVIDVYNSVAEERGISIHWHGLSMKGANEMDGVVGVTQCAIGPSESYTYRFRIDDSQFGTFWHVAFLFPGLVHDFPRTPSRLNGQQLIPGFSFSLGQAPMTIIAVDGGNPVAPDTPRATLIGYLNFHLTNFALTPKQSFPVRWRGNSEEVQEDDHQGDNHEPITPFNLAHLSGSLVTADVVKEPTDRSVVYTSMAIRSASGLRPVGSVNRTAWVVADPRAPPLLALNRSEWERVTKQPGPVWTLDVPQGMYSTWPGNYLHQHGYEFYVVSKFQQTQLGFPGTYNPFDLVSAPLGGPMNTVNPLRKDTVYIPRNGYVVLRFPLENDGLWLLHCHTLWHLASGMGMVIQIGDIVEDIKQRTAALCSK
ncbi:hypothetical protein CDV55_106464 [Aspergillus turcosus]|nr:hypothetical protein CDV55_106464 [Aspergillus turcosus]